MTTKLRTVLIARLMREDQSGLGYCFNQMKWKIHNMWDTYTKKALREKITGLTDSELESLSSFRTYKPLFSKTPIQVHLPSCGGIYSVSVESEDFTVGKDNRFYLTLDRYESDRVKNTKVKHRCTIILNN